MRRIEGWCRRPAWKKAGLGRVGDERVQVCEGACECLGGADESRIEDGPRRLACTQHSERPLARTGIRADEEQAGRQAWGRERESWPMEAKVAPAACMPAACRLTGGRDRRAGVQLEREWEREGA